MGRSIGSILPSPARLAFCLRAGLAVLLLLLSDNQSIKKAGTIHMSQTHHFRENSVEFTEKNIRTNLNAVQEMVEMHPQFTPTDGEVLIGFDKEKISEKLGL
jgi:hypothetical protein